MNNKKIDSFSQIENIDLDTFDNLNKNFISGESYDFFNNLRLFYLKKPENQKIKGREIHQFFLELDKKFEKISLKYTKNDIGNKIIRIILGTQNDYKKQSDGINEILNKLKKISNMFFLNYGVDFSLVEVIDIIDMINGNNIIDFPMKYKKSKTHKKNSIENAQIIQFKK